MITIIIGIPVAGRASFCTVACGTGVAAPERIRVLDPDVLPTRIALGLEGALSDAPGSDTGTVNSRIESIPALIVISVRENADVIVRTYDAPAVNAEAVLIIASAPLVVDSVIERIFTLSLVSWSMIRTLTVSARTAWLNTSVIDFALVIRIVSSNNGTLPIVGVVVVVVVSIVSTHEFVTPVVVKFAPVAAKTDNMGIVMTINSIALRRKRNIR